MKKQTLLKLILFLASIVICCLVTVACSFDYSAGNHDVPDAKRNEVIFIEHNRLSFALGMEIDLDDVIVKCKITFVENGEEFKVDGQTLSDGTVTYEPFDLTTVGFNKRIAVKYKDAVNYIFYDVNDYKVNFYTDGEKTELWKTVTPNAELTDNLGLSVWVNMSQYNYSTDEGVREQNPDNAKRFCGWMDSSDNLATGYYLIAPPVTENLREIQFHAHYLTDEQLAEFDLSYDGSGRRVFSGYKGEDTDRVVIPEGVTYVDLVSVFKTAPNFARLHFPSTAQMDFPLLTPINSAGLTEVTVNNGSTLYASYGGALYSKDMTTLYFMPSSLTKVEFSPDVNIFASYSCAYWQIPSIRIPDGVTSLQHYCFAYSAIKDVYGLSGVHDIKSGVFYKSAVMSFEDEGKAYYTILPDDNGNYKYILDALLDSSLTSYKVINGTVGIAGDAFKGCIYLETVDLGGVESIGASAFSGCTALKSITFPSTVKYVGQNVFYGCTALTEVKGLPNVVFMDAYGNYRENTLPDYMFYGCSSLESVTLPDGIEDIGEYAFSGCSGLTELAIPDSVEIIGAHAFYGSAVKDIVLPSSLVYLGNYAFSHMTAESVDFTKANKLTMLSMYCFSYSTIKEVDIPESITSIPNYCFYNMTSLTRVSLGGAQTIGTYAFGRCSKLTDVDLGNVLTIGQRAFSTCSSLKTINVTDGVTIVDGYAFASCGNLESVHIGKGLRTLGSYAFGADGVSIDTRSPAFYLCAKLKEFTVSEDNACFIAKDGVLFGRYIERRDFGVGGVLYVLPSAYAGTSYALPSEVRVTLPYSAHGLVSLSSITLNEGLENIGLATFYNSAKLTTVTVPSTVTYIGARIFLGCDNFESIVIAEGNKTYSSENGLLYTGSSLIWAPPKIKGGKVEIKDGITEIAQGVFMDNKSITELVIPDSVTTIGDKAFNGCTSLISVTIGSGLADLNPSAFSALPSLAAITVSDNNPNFKSVNDVLYSKDGKTLLLAAAQNGMTTLDGIESGVTAIGDWAFAYHATLTEVMLETGVKSIGSYSFYECRSVTRFYGCETLEAIGERAFSFATSVNPNDSAETRFCDALQTVVLYANTKTIGDNAFYGQYGITDVFLRMSLTEATALNYGSLNVGYLLSGCPNGSTGEKYNNVNKYLYSAAEPTIYYDGYDWFYFRDGEPEMWANPNAKSYL